MNTTIRELIEYLKEIPEEYLDIPIVIGTNYKEIRSIQIDCYTIEDTCIKSVELFMTNFNDNYIE